MAEEDSEIMIPDEVTMNKIYLIRERGKCWIEIWLIFMFELNMEELNQQNRKRIGYKRKNER
ncbi:MAG: hypothetical protein JW731_15270 [Bacteroidales bacterium]|nr:hypothetical protein [Bacteroidales bacterium]